MAKFLVRGTLTRDGIRDSLGKAKGSGLRAAVSRFAESAGGRVDAYYFAFGPDDIVGIVDVPDNVTAVAMSIAGNAAGFIRLNITPLITPEEMDKAVEKSAGLAVPGR